jgi:cell division protein FtsB
MPSTAPQLRNRLPRLAEAAVERALLTVVPRRRTRAPRVPFVSLVSVLLLGGVVGLLLFNTSMQQASFAATALEEQASSLSAREQTLEMELDRLNDPQRVAEAARRQGLVDPPPPAFLDLDSGRIIGEPTPATGANITPVKPPPPIRPPELDPPPITLEPRRGGGRDESRGSGSNGQQDRQGDGQRDDESRR